MACKKRFWNIIFRYYGDADDDRLELGRAIYQIEQTLQRCLEIRRRKELELSLLQQPILNWSGEPIEKLGTMRLMVQLSIRAGRDQRTTRKGADFFFQILTAISILVKN